MAPASASCRPRPSNAVTVRGHGISRMASLVAAAMAIGRLPGEPASVLPPPGRRRLLARLLGIRPRSALADPRLEVIRAISAALASGATPVRGELVAAAFNAGWSLDELRRALPHGSLAQLI